jgi:DNA-binding MarR family transcriptional regulator
MSSFIDTSDFNETIAPWLGKTYKMMDHFISDVFHYNKIQVTKQQWLLLKILLEEKKGMIQNDLAFVTNRNKASLTRLLNVMEKNDLVKRKPSKKDSRKNLIYCTQTGTDLFLKMKPLMLNSLQTLQKGISKDEMKLFIDIMSKIQTNIKNQSN